MPPLDSNSAQFLDRSIRRGSAILFTGAGFSSAAFSRSGLSIPLGSELKAALWEVAFPGEPLEPDSSLGEVFDIAASTAGGITRTLLNERLTVDPNRVPPFYEAYFRIPWFRIYTINLDTLAQACSQAFHLGGDFYITSGRTDPIPPPDELAVIHLNGTLSDYPDVTFSPPQYGQLAAHTNNAYAILARDLAAHPVIFVGTQLDEPALWQHIALRGERPVGRELRPKSFLVTPNLPRARAAMLERFNIVHVPLTAEEFATIYLTAAAADRIPRTHFSHERGDPWLSIALALGEPPESPADFLLGREPTWSDITSGFAIQREFETDLFEQAKKPDSRLTLVSGTAGSGKSTTLRRLALRLQAEGQDVRWLRLEANQSLTELRASGVATGADVLIIDQAERFGHRGPELIAWFAEATDGPRVVVAYAGGPYDEFSVESALAHLGPHVVVVPLLDDTDIDRLIEALTASNRLGRLAGKTHAEQFAAIKSRAHRQLLVALLEATSGQRFEQKIASECEQLAADLAMAYGVLALATSHSYRLSVEDLLAALSDVTAAGLDVVDRLVRQHVVLKLANGSLVTRHPLVAREVVTYYRRTGQLGEALARLAFVMASKYYASMPRTPERRLLRTLINHEYVGQVIDSRVQIRQMYDELEPLLREDSHYWLQRGSYELERGDLGLAENFLAQAQALSSGDYMVQTEWAYLMLERSCRDPANTRAPSWFDEAFEMLLDVIDRVGERSPNTYVILAEKTVAWAASGPLSFEDRKKLLETVRSTLKIGSRFHSGNRQFSSAVQKVEEAYLSLSLE